MSVDAAAGDDARSVHARRRSRARHRRRTRERGIAIIMVVGAIAVLTVMLAQFQDDTSAAVASATADRDGLKGEYMARSAVNLARLVIATEPTVRAAISPLYMLMKSKPPQLPVWEFSDRLLAAFNDQDTVKDWGNSLGLDMSLGKNLGLAGGKFQLSIVDEDAKIDVNLGAANDIAHIRLAREIMGLISPVLYDPMFQARDANGQFHDRLETCAAIIDWADADEQGFNCDTTTNAPTRSGVEDSSYSLLQKPYRRKNAPYDSLEELHMVNGITDDFWATFVDPDPTNPKKRVMTVWGQGAVNVNTANAQTLFALVCAGAPLADVCTDPTQASAFLMGITMARAITQGAPIFGSTKDFLNMMKGKGMLGPMVTLLGMKPVKFQSESDFLKSITIESKLFSIYAVGIVKGYKRETRTGIHAVVDFREAPTINGPSLSSVLDSFTGAASSSTAGGGGTAASASATNTNYPMSGSGPSSPGPIAAATAVTAAGQVIYFHIE
jgi:general secretion pathway protein K